MPLSHMHGYVLDSMQAVWVSLSVPETAACSSSLLAGQSQKVCKSESTTPQRGQRLECDASISCTLAFDHVEPEMIASRAHLKA